MESHPAFLDKTKTEGLQMEALADEALKKFKSQKPKIEAAASPSGAEEDSQELGLGVMEEAAAAEKPKKKGTMYYPFNHLSLIYSSIIGKMLKHSSMCLSHIFWKFLGYMEGF